MKSRILSIALVIAFGVVGAGLSGCVVVRGDSSRSTGSSKQMETSGMTGVEGEVLGVLDTLHAAAARADERAYFGAYAPEAVFIGTDAGERWTKEEFRAYAKPYFDQGKGWTYVPREGSRHVTVLPDGDARVAFFEELLENEKYGTCRGTGVVRKERGRWLVSQYHLTFPVPNEMAAKVTGEIRAWEGK